MPHHTTSKNTIIALLGSNLLLAAISAMYTRITERAEVSPKRSTPSSSSNLKYKTPSSSRFPLISTFLFLFEPGYYITVRRRMVGIYYRTNQTLQSRTIAHRTVYRNSGGRTLDESISQTASFQKTR
ncbi:hypothetical protein M378DRAFT_315401 [Amanita muscaria Koide BX008]|uniref:Uncharacterized protein n=1 Tax=Amanita muscaria (strain Koide BX008) TaxID=946122 RepID=A0A0C2WPB7_AMAMK|nr:hypothetical protein M378DRAFT_315401 [Amanita muscaria Koide BX008]